MLKWLAASIGPERRASPDAGPGAGARSAPPQPAATTPLETSALPFDSLGKDDRRRYQGALEAETRGQFREAWQTLLPIVDSHRRVYEVQELRCRLAQKQRFFPAVEEAHCAPRAVLRGPANR